MSLVRLIINTPLTTVGFQSVCDLAPGKWPALINFQNYIGAVAGGEQSAQLSFAVGATQAIGLITSTGTATAAQAFTIANVTITARASGAVVNEFNVSATPSVQAANIAAAINASPSLAGKVTATSALGVVTATSVVPGVAGNGLQLGLGSLTNVTVTAFAGGTEGTSTVLNFL